jgi:hypothetical protein
MDPFTSHLKDAAPPDHWPLAVQALWWDARGDWARAHELAQAREDQPGNWVHAYLHRREGDIGNARYWYRRAGRPTATGDLDRERGEIAAALLGG